jgi:hypothetical protein
MSVLAFNHGFAPPKQPQREPLVTSIIDKVGKLKQYKGLVNLLKIH